MGDPHGTGKMTVEGDPPFFLGPQGPFVTTRGGEYLFVPGMRRAGGAGGLSVVRLRGRRCAALTASSREGESAGSRRAVVLCANCVGLLRFRE